MQTKRTKEEIYQMLRYVLEAEDMEDENLLAHWTDVLFEVHKIRQKFPRPTSALLEMNEKIFQTRKMNIGVGGVKIDSNHNEFWLKDNIPDVKIYGDVTLENSDKNVTVIGNINGEKINIKGDLNADTLCNVGNATINCEKLIVDTFRVSGNITINAKEIEIGDYISDKSTITGNIKATFFNSNKTEIKGEVNSTFINGTSDENFKVDLNNP